MKAIWKSKTLWAAGLLAALTGFSTVLQTWITSHPGFAGSAVSSLIVFLRLITTKQLVVFKQPQSEDLKESFKQPLPPPADTKPK